MWTRRRIKIFHRKNMGRSRRKSCQRPVVECLLSCLKERKFPELLKWINEKELQFAILLKHKKASSWTEKDLLFFKELDALSETKKIRYKKQIDYDQSCKRRCKANLRKLVVDKVIEFIKDEKNNKSIKWRHYRFVEIPVSNELKNGLNMSVKGNNVETEEVAIVPTSSIPSTSYCKGNKIGQIDCSINEPKLQMFGNHNELTIDGFAIDDNLLFEDSLLVNPLTDLPFLTCKNILLNHEITSSQSTQDTEMSNLLENESIENIIVDQQFIENTSLQSTQDTEMSINFSAKNQTLQSIQDTEMSINFSAMDEHLSDIMETSKAAVIMNASLQSTQDTEKSINFRAKDERLSDVMETSKATVIMNTSLQSTQDTEMSINFSAKEEHLLGVMETSEDIIELLKIIQKDS